MNRRREAEFGGIALTCRLCGARQTSPGLDLGAQPVSNRFKDQADEPLVCFSVQMAQCVVCGLVQLARSAPPEAIRPRRSWMRYREREDHLVDVMQTFRPFLAGVPQESQVVGVTDFDGVLAGWLSATLPINYAQLSPRSDLEIEGDVWGMETFQRALSPERARRFVEKHEKAQVVVSRYLLEHAENPAGLLHAFRELLGDAGFLIVEVPDAEAPLERHDYQMIWEEHFSYFTVPTLCGALERNGFAVRSIFKAASHFEQPLLVLAQKVEGAAHETAMPENEATRFLRFCESFAGRAEATREFCRRHHEAGRKIVLFGAGHFSVALVSLFQVEELIAGVVDDDPNKAALFLPGTKLPVVSSGDFNWQDPLVLLLCVNPDVETRVMEKLKTLIPPEESCYSIFAGSPRFFLHE